MHSALFLKNKQATPCLIITCQTLFVTVGEKKKSVKSSHPRGIHSSLLVLVFSLKLFFPPCFTLGRSLFWTAPPSLIWENWEVGLIYNPLFSGSMNMGWACDFWAAGFLIEMVEKKCPTAQACTQSPGFFFSGQGGQEVKDSSVGEREDDREDRPLDLFFFKQF